MPAAVSQSHSDMPRVAWSLLLATLEELDAGGDGVLPLAKARLLAGQLEDPADLPALTASLLDLAVMLWLELHGGTSAACEHARTIAIDMAGT